MIVAAMLFHCFNPLLFTHVKCHTSHSCYTSGLSKLQIQKLNTIFRLVLLPLTFGLLSNSQPKKRIHHKSLHQKCKRMPPVNGILEVKNTNKSIRISSKSPVDWLGKLKMANPLRPARAAKSCRLTGNEGPLESKHTTYHEVRHPNRQLSHQRWDHFMGN